MPAIRIYCERLLSIVCTRKLLPTIEYNKNWNSGFKPWFTYIFRYATVTLTQCVCELVQSITIFAYVEAGGAGMASILY